MSIKYHLTAKQMSLEFHHWKANVKPLDCLLPYLIIKWQLVESKLVYKWWSSGVKLMSSGNQLIAKW